MYLTFLLSRHEGCVHIALRWLPEIPILPPRVTMTIILALCMVPLYAASSLESKRVVHATWISVATYISWLGCIAYAHSQGVLRLHPHRDHLGSLWQGTSCVCIHSVTSITTKTECHLATIAFAFATSSTLSLYASLDGTDHPVSTKISRFRSFMALSTISAALATALIVPVAFFSRFPNEPVRFDVPTRLCPH
jgi:hypothetical protein